MIFANRNVINSSMDGDIMNHVAYSKSRKHVGTFIFSRLLENIDEYLLLPGLEVLSKTTKNIERN